MRLRIVGLWVFAWKRHEMSDLSGQVALVTGAAVRTGRAIALGLAGEGANIFIHYNRNHQQALQLADEIRAMGCQAWVGSADFCDAAAVNALADQLINEVGRLDLLVNNVGNYPVKSPLECSPDEMREVFEANLIAPFALIQQLMPLLQQSASAQVVNLGYAGVELITANTKVMAYQMSKTALLVMTKTLAKELGPLGVRVNMVSPGQLENSVDLPPNIADRVPLQRAGRTQDIVDAIVYLSKKESYITGINLEVAGGYRLALA